MDLEERSVKSLDSVGIWPDFLGLLRGLCVWKWLEVGEVSRLVDLERRFVVSQDSVGIRSDFSGLPRGLCVWKVGEGGWTSERS